MKNSWMRAAGTLALVAVLACAEEPAESDSSVAVGGAQPTLPGASRMPQLQPDTPLDRIPAECQGFEVRGLKYSPGGDTLPNTCAPFHGTYNNPYAIRCIDADPGYKTRWQGDEFCILAPPPELGVQLYVGPKDFDDAAEVGKYELQPGEESNTYYYLNSPNTERHYYYRTNYRMRGGSHHMIISVLPQDQQDGWAPSSQTGTDLGMGAGFGGSQRPDSDRPSGALQVPAEDVGLGAELAAKQQFAFNLHHNNHFETPILREAWVNVWYQNEVTKMARPATLFGNPSDVAIPPGEHRVLHYSAEVTGDLRIISYFGHRHVSTDRFGIWVERSSGEKISAYESFSWEDMPVYAYDSITKNPVPDVANQIDGGHSGLLELTTGDKVHFVCDITNRQDAPLRFANELYSGEMCIAFGTGVGSGTLGRPTRVMD